MARRYYSSTAVATTLSASANNSDTSITVTALSGYPVSTPWTAIIDPDTASEEVVEVTNVSGTTLTVTRGVDGTSGTSHSAGAVFRHGVSARDFDEANAFVNGGGVANSLIQNSKGSLITSTGSAVDDLTVGTDGHVLTADSNETLGIKWAAPAGGMSLLDSQTFTSSTTYSVPTDAKVIVVECLGAGGGGGGGGRNTSTSTTGGGGGGGGGGYWRETYTGAEVSGSVTVTIGAGGTGGTGRTGSTGAGTNGNRGGSSRFAIAYWPGAGGGLGGATGTAAGGFAGAFMLSTSTDTLQAGRGGTSGAAAGGSAGVRNWRGGGGGGGGGGATSVARTGGDGGSSHVDAAEVASTTLDNQVVGRSGGGGAGGAVDGGAGVTGTSLSGGGGGGSSRTTAGGVGGDGATPGGGGGGGGAANDDNDGGNGGAGGNAQIKVWIYG